MLLFSLLESTFDICITTIMRRFERQRSDEGRPLSPPKNFVPPAQQQEPRITNTSQLIRSWSTRTTRLCLNAPPSPPPPMMHAPRSLTSEVADWHPGSWEETYRKDLLDLFEGQIACDVTFRIIGDASAPDHAPETVVRAHRCILAARNSALLNESGVKAVAAASAAAAPATSSQHQEEVEDILVSDDFYVRDPSNLRTVIAACYGANADLEDVLSDLTKLDPNWEPPLHSDEDDDESNDRVLAPSASRTKSVEPADVCICASRNASQETEVEWAVEAHIAVLCAHSDYFRSALSRNWSTETNETGHKRLVRLDSTLFTYDTVQELVSACYGTSLDVCQEPLESILHLIDGATYLGMKAVSLRCEEALGLRINETNLADIMQFAEDNAAQRLLLECHKYLCRNLESVSRAGTLRQLQRPQLEAMLKSNFVEASEDRILEALLTWSEETAALYDETKDLIQFIRLPFVPVDSGVMTRAVQQNLVGEDMVRACRLFQTDGDYRKTMMNCEPLYRPRQSMATRLQFIRAIRESYSFESCRMLGTVNGRENFEKIRSVTISESGEHLVCVFPESRHLDFRIPFFQFGGLETKHQPTAKERAKERVDRDSLESLQIEDAKQLLMAMLQREDELRLHPRVQSKIGAIGENEEEMSRFTTALQGHVASEFNVDPIVGIELLHSASTLFPDIAQIAHYVRHNRCFEGCLRVGDTAPDVALTTLAGDPTTLWSELDVRNRCARSSKVCYERKPVVILGASYT